jgi:2-hydroxy-6-oxonona-2,4-dienedioate hydrolase
MIWYPAEIAGTLTRVAEAGDGDRVVVLVHGVASRADRWRHNLDPLAAEGYHVFAVDLPGHGFARKGAGPQYSVPAFAAFVEGILDFAGVERAVLVGTSLGGHVVGWLAAHRPDRVTSLVLVGSVGVVPLGEERRQRTRQRLTDVSEAGVRSKFEVLVHDQALVTDEWVREEMLINSSPGAADSLSAIARYFGDDLDNDVVGPELGHLCAAGAFPVLLVWGAEEVAFPLSIGLEAVDVITGSCLAVIAKTAHAPYFENPQAFNRIVADFLGGRLGSWESPDVDYRMPDAVP